MRDGPMRRRDIKEHLAFLPPGQDGSRPSIDPFLTVQARSHEVLAWIYYIYLKKKLAKVPVRCTGRLRSVYSEQKALFGLDI